MIVENEGFKTTQDDCVKRYLPPQDSFPKQSKQERIIKLFTGRYLDLEQVLSITDAYFINQMGSGDYFVGFDIVCKNPPIHNGAVTASIKHVEPLKYNLDMDYIDYASAGAIGRAMRLKMIDGTFEKFYEITEEKTKDIKSVNSLQLKVDEIVKQWKAYCEM